MDLGIFDHLDRREGVPLDEFYESRLRLLEKYDAAGFYSYHLAEHHATPLGLAPGARHLPRRGHPAHAAHPPRPLRLLPAALRPAPADRGGLHARSSLARAASTSAWDAASCPTRWRTSTCTISRPRRSTRRRWRSILQGLTSDVLDHRGPRYTYRKVPMVLRPFQQPHPPLWYGLGHMAGAEWAATNRVQRHRATIRATRSRPLFDALPRGVAAQARGCRDAEAGHRPPRRRWRRPRPQAEALARPNYAAWYANLTKLWRDFGARPHPLRARLRRGAPARHRHRGHARRRCARRSSARSPRARAPTSSAA